MDVTGRQRNEIIPHLPIVFPSIIGYNVRMTTTNIIPAAFIPVNNSIKVSVIEITERLSSMYGVIGGGCDVVARVALNENYNACLWVDEEAMLKNAPLNIRASCLAGRPIYGNAIMAGEDAQYNIVPLSIACPKIFFDYLDEEAVRFVYDIVKEQASKIRM